MAQGFVYLVRRVVYGDAEQIYAEQNLQKGCLKKDGPFSMLGIVGNQQMEAEAFNFVRRLIQTELKKKGRMIHKRLAVICIIINIALNRWRGGNVTESLFFY
ncbi:MAG: hypothetical protein VB064_03885 [Oscillospiraceae bacterium]|nr:hypothetical protein [Oscillospiraceae bacterium]